MFQWIRRLLLVLAVPVLLGGCWDVEDVSHRGTPNTLFLDLGDRERIRFGCSFHVPGSLLPPSNSTEQLFQKRNYTLYGEGIGLLDAWRDLQTISTRDIFLGQISAIILSERFARKNLDDLIDFINRRAEIPSDTLVMVTKSDPKKLVDIKLSNNFVPGTHIFLYFKSIAKRSMAIPVRLWELDKSLTNGNPDPHLPYIKTTQGLYQIAGTALYSGPIKVGELSVAETQILSLILGEKYGYMTVPYQGNKLVAYFDITSKTRIEPRMNQPGRVSFKIRIKTTGALRETYPRNIPITMEEKRRYEQATENFLKEKISRLLHKLRRLNADPIGLGNKVRIKYPTRWTPQKWRQIYPNSTFRVELQFKFDNTGVVQ